MKRKREKMKRWDYVKYSNHKACVTGNCKLTVIRECIHSFLLLCAFLCISGDMHNLIL